MATLPYYSALPDKGETLRPLLVAEKRTTKSEFKIPKKESSPVASFIYNAHPGLGHSPCLLSSLNLVEIFLCVCVCGFEAVIAKRKQRKHAWRFQKIQVERDCFISSESSVQINSARSASKN